jgi:hypothetical protein
MPGCLSPSHHYFIDFSLLFAFFTLSFSPILAFRFSDAFAASAYDDVYARTQARVQQRRAVRAEACVRARSEDVYGACCLPLRFFAFAIIFAMARRAAASRRYCRFYFRYFLPPPADATKGAFYARNMAIRRRHYFSVFDYLFRSSTPRFHAATPLSFSDFTLLHYRFIFA